MQKIYFIEKSIPFNANDLNLSLISGTEKILINISNELAKDNNLKIKVFNKNINNLKINNVEWYNLNDWTSLVGIVGLYNQNLNHGVCPVCGVAIQYHV